MQIKYVIKIHWRNGNPLGYFLASAGADNQAALDVTNINIAFHFNTESDARDKIGEMQHVKDVAIEIVKIYINE